MSIVNIENAGYVPRLFMSRGRAIYIFMLKLFHLLSSKLQTKCKTNSSGDCADRLNQKVNHKTVSHYTKTLPVLAQLAGGSAMALALSFPRSSWLAWVSLLPLLVSIRFHRPCKAMLHGIAWSASLWAVLLFCAAPDQTITISAGAYSILIISFYTWLGAIATRHVGFHPLVLGVMWMFVGLALTPLGWHEKLMAEVYTSSGWLSLISHALGCVFVGFVVAFITASFVSAAIIVCVNNPKKRHLQKISTTIFHSVCGDRVLQQILELVEADPRAPPGQIDFNHRKYKSEYIQHDLECVQ